MSFLDVLLSFATGTVRTQAVDSGGSVVAIPGNLVLCTTSTAGVTVAPPAAPVRGSLFGVADDSATSATHAITVAGAGGLFTLESPASPGTYATSVTIATNSQVVWWLYTGAAWKIVAIETFAGGGGAPTGPAGGDLHGTYPNPGVGALWGVAVSSTAPSSGQVLTDVGGVWTPATPSGAPTGAASGSLAGTYPNPTIAASGVTAATYGDATHVAQVAVSADGRVTSASSVTISATVAAGWVTLVDLDFTAQTTQVMATDGSYTIGGLSWTKGNSTNDNVAMTITNLTGLVITPKAGGTNMAGTAAATNAPFLWIGLTTLGLATPTWMTRIKVFVSVGADNNTADFDTFVFGLTTLPVSGTGIKLGYMGQRGHATSTSLGNIQTVINSVRTVTANASLVADKTMMVTLDPLAATQPRLFFAGALAAGAAFPSENTYKPIASQAALLDSGPSGALPTDLGLLLSAARASSANAYVTTIQRIRLDYQ